MRCAVTASEEKLKSTIRVIAHLDLDCFYAQVEQRRLNIPDDIPVAVQQWNGIIAVNYSARQYGVRRGQRVPNAQKLCPLLRLVHVDIVSTEPNDHKGSTVPDRQKHKASLTRYRQASQEVLDIVARHYPGNFERASIDEVYIDLQDNVVRLLRQIFDLLWHRQRDFMNTFVAKDIIDIGQSEIERCPVLDTLPILSERKMGKENATWLSEEILKWVTTWLRWLDLYYNGLELNLPVIAWLQKMKPFLLDMATAVYHPTEGLLSILAKQHPLRDTVMRRATMNQQPTSSFLVSTACPEEIPLLLGALCIFQTRDAIQKETQFTVSAGIGRTKFLAKEISARYKPNAQTILLDIDVPDLLKQIPLTEARNLRGKMGHLIATLLPDVRSLYDVAHNYTFPQLKQKLRAGGSDEQTAQWLYQVATGTWNEPVRSVCEVKSMMACKTFYETTTIEGLKHYVALISLDLAERLIAENRERQRLPKSFSIHQTGGCPFVSRVRVIPPFVLGLQDVAATKAVLYQRTMAVISSRFTSTELFPCTCLGIRAQFDSTSNLATGSLQCILGNTKNNQSSTSLALQNPLTAKPDAKLSTTNTAASVTSDGGQQPAEGCTEEVVCLHTSQGAETNSECHATASSPIKVLRLYRKRPRITTTGSGFVRCVQPPIVVLPYSNKNETNK